MKKIIYILILVFFCSNLKVTSQIVKRDSIILSGVISESDSLKSLSFSTFVINNKKGGISNEYGHFRMRVITGDTIVFSHIGYNQLVFIVSDTLNIKEYIVGIFLSTKLTKIKEVIIHPKITKTSISNAIKNMKSDKTVVYAMNNMNLANYQARTKANTNWDAEMNQNYAVKQYQGIALNKGFLVQNQINISTSIPISFAMISGVYKTKQNKYKITRYEEELIKISFLKSKNKTK